MLHFNILHYQFLWIFHDKIQSNMHNFTLFSREIEWNLKCFHFFREMKSETNIPFTLFEKWKVKWFFVSLFSRSESEIEIPRDRDREVKFQKKSREFSRNETLAGYWNTCLWNAQYHQTELAEPMLGTERHSYPYSCRLQTNNALWKVEQLLPFSCWETKAEQ